MLELATSCLSPHRPNGAIAAKLTIALGGRIRGSSCGVEEVSSEAVTRQQRNTPSIPDVTIRCGEQPRIVFELVSPPTELRHVQECD